MGDRWGPDGPPDEAYSRVSDPERYRGLHALGRQVLADLERRFDVRRESTAVPDRQGEIPAAAVRLVPADPDASPLTVVFTAFPGLELRFGRGQTAHLPICGCDACDDTLDDCAAQLAETVAWVTAGTFGERLVRTAEPRMPERYAGSAGISAARRVRSPGWTLEQWYASSTGEGSSRTAVSRAERSILRRKLPRTWHPWPERVSDP